MRKYLLLGSFVAINLKNPQSRKWSTCQSLKNFTLGCPCLYNLINLLILKLFWPLNSNQILHYLISFLGPEAASAAADVQVGDSNALLKFVKNYGTHYFKSVTIGDAIYQVFAVSKDQMQKLKSSLGGRKTVGLREWSSLHENYLGMS